MRSLAGKNKFTLKTKNLYLIFASIILLIFAIYMQFYMSEYRLIKNPDLEKGIQYELQEWDYGEIVL